jgi:hypothetical protein
MLEMNLNMQIDNINYLRYMEHKEAENGDLKGNYESERATLTEQHKKNK